MGLAGQRRPAFRDVQLDDGEPARAASDPLANGFVNVVLPMSFGDKSILTPEVMNHYRGPLATVADRQRERRPAVLHPGSASLAGRNLASDVQTFADKPALVIWGGADIAFREKEFNVWKEAMRNGTFHLIRRSAIRSPRKSPMLPSATSAISWRDRACERPSHN